MPFAAPATAVSRCGHPRISELFKLDMSSGTLIEKRYSVSRPKISYADMGSHSVGSSRMLQYLADFSSLPATVLTHHSMTGAWYIS